jgi:hypothetical protein
MRPALRRIAWGAVVTLLGSAAQAQQNPLQRGASSAPRFATANRVPDVTQHAATGFSPFSPTCGDTSGTVYIGAEVEPHIAVNPLNPNNLVGAWQQDRYSNGSSRGVVTGASFDGGVTWTTRSIAVSVCTGGSYARATDPWVTFSPDGTVHQVVLGVTGSTFGGSGGVIVARSTDGGLTWSAPIAIHADGAGFFNDKETITADPTDARFVYAVWDRLESTGGGPTMFARTTNGGLTWEAARQIYVPGGSDQTIGNLIRVLPNGTLVNVMTVARANSRTVAIIRSGDKGLTWSAPISISNLGSLGARDPFNGAQIRDGAILAEMAVGPDGTLHAVWQDARFTGVRDAIAYSRSSDGGSTWSTPVRVNSDPTVVAFTPQVHVRDDGVIGITFYDLRSDTSAGDTPLTDFWLARSSDGVQWTETRLSDPFDLNLAPNAGGLFLGDYTGLVSVGSTFIAFFGRTSAASPLNRTDIIAARVAPPPFAALAAKRTPGSWEESAPYRAQVMPEEDPGEAFWEAVSANARRALEARRHRAGEPEPAMR